MGWGGWGGVHVTTVSNSNAFAELRWVLTTKMLVILQRQRQSEVSPNKTHTCHLLDTTVHGIQVCTHSCGHSPPGVSTADKSLSVG